MNDRHRKNQQEFHFSAISKNWLFQRLLPGAYILLLSLTACSSQERTPEASLTTIINERALLSDKEKTFQLSAKYYLALQELDPDNIDYHIGYIRALRNIRDELSFRNYIKAWGSGRPVSSKDSFIIEIVFTKLSFGWKTEAENFLEKNKTNISDPAQLFWLRGAINLQKEQFLLAEDNFKKCLLSDPQNEGCIFDYSLLLLKTNRTSELKEFLKSRNRLDLLDQLIE
jgi:tetratricopeptide (TPR) repeat protein